VGSLQYELGKFMIIASGGQAKSDAMAFAGAGA